LESLPWWAVWGTTMTGMTSFIHRLSRDQDGATAIEYGLMAALISVAAITAMGALGNSLANTFNFVESQEAAAQNGQL
jgi:pilus assembly protein Flp/PilA